MDQYLSAALPFYLENLEILLKAVQQKPSNFDLKMSNIYDMNENTQFNFKVFYENSLKYFFMMYNLNYSYLYEKAYF